MPNRILALDLQGSQLVAVLVETSFRNYRFVAHHTETREPGRPLPEQLRGFVERHGLSADTVLSTLPRRSVAHRILDLPFRDRRKLQQTVPFEIESRVPFALEDTIVDFQVISRTAGGARVLAALASREAIEQHLKMLTEAGLEPAIVDFGPLSTLNVLQLFEGERPERYAFLHVVQGQGTFAFYENGSLGGLRVLDVSGEPLASGLSREIRWTLKSFDGRGPSGDSDRLPLLLAGAASDEMIETLRSDLGCTVQRLEELPLRHLPPSFREHQGDYAPAIGLALREIAEAPTLGLNFRQQEFAYHRAQQEIRDVLSRFGILAAVIVLLAVTSAVVSYTRLSREYESAASAVRRAFVETLPEQPVIHDETLQLTQALESMRRRAQQFPGGGSFSALEVLRELSVKAPSEPRMQVDELSFDAESLRIRAHTVSFEAVEAVKRSLAGSALFRDVQVKDPRTTKDGEVEFRLIVLFGKDVAG